MAFWFGFETGVMTLGALEGVALFVIFVLSWRASRRAVATRQAAGTAPARSSGGHP